MNKNLVAIPLKTFIIIVSKEWPISYKLLSHPRFFSVSCHLVGPPTALATAKK
jgi:hypothetical protein